MSGYDEPECKVPCLQTRVNVQDGPQQTVLFSKNVVFVKFNQKIQREVISVDKFDFMETLNVLGSNLGLWPGLGLFHLLEIFVAIFLSYKAKLKYCNKIMNV